uniref:Uncharacterized protein n=1 Tax=Triticum urartu TaxID=4572 RepID=A0A8R7QY35_TRIUA
MGSRLEKTRSSSSSKRRRRRNYDCAESSRKRRRRSSDCAESPMTRRKQHLYLAMDDWEEGYHIYTSSTPMRSTQEVCTSFPSRPPPGYTRRSMAPRISLLWVPTSLSPSTFVTTSTTTMTLPLPQPSSTTPRLKP